MLSAEGPSQQCLENGRRRRPRAARRPEPAGEGLDARAGCADRTVGLPEQPPHRNHNKLKPQPLEELTTQYMILGFNLISSKVNISQKTILLNVKIQKLHKHLNIFT